MRSALVLVLASVTGCGGADPSWAITTTPRPAGSLAALAAGPGGTVLSIVDDFRIEIQLFARDAQT